MCIRDRCLSTTSQVLVAAIKFADLGHVVKPFRLHDRWTMMATREFWRLGDKEKKMGVSVRRAHSIGRRACQTGSLTAHAPYTPRIDAPRHLAPASCARHCASAAAPQVSPLCDRDNHNKAGSQLGFLKFVCLPFYSMVKVAALLAMYLATTGSSDPI